MKSLSSLKARLAKLTAARETADAAPRTTIWLPNKRGGTRRADFRSGPAIVRFFDGATPPAEITESENARMGTTTKGT